MKQARTGLAVLPGSGGRAPQGAGLCHLHWFTAVADAGTVRHVRSGGTKMAKHDPSSTGPDGPRTQPAADRRIALPIKLERHPVVLKQQEQRAADFQLRAADRITAFAGSMNFVYLHVALFTVWMLFIESKPWPTLTLIVSLEAIFLSTFVMIGQNREAAFQQAKADHDFNEQELELKTNTQLTREIDRLTIELHNRLLDGRAQ
jgi:uncharacterized membrane protein